MGCLQSKSENISTKSNVETEEKPKYSWERRPKIDINDITIEDKKDETLIRLPGTINGTEFIIKNCEGCTIYILDHTNSIQIDDCTGCKIFLGPVKTSVFIRDCKDCKVALTCQQYRTRDCKAIDTFIACVSQPITEASTSMKFGCLQCYYPQLEDQFKQAGLSIYNNNWSNIYDFTPVPGETNFTLISNNGVIETCFPLPSEEEFNSVQFSFDPTKSLIPATLGSQRKQYDESCLVVFFHDGESHARAKRLIAELMGNSNCVLVQTKEIAMQQSDALRVFNTDSYAEAVQKGAVIALEYCGPDVCQTCQKSYESIGSGATNMTFISSDAAAAQQQVEQFYNFADMQMNG